MAGAIQELLVWLASPTVGLPAVFLMSLLAATLLPVGSEPVVLAYLSAAPTMFWATIWVATAGNTLGGLVSYGMGAGAHGLFGRWRQRQSANDRAPSLTAERARVEKWVSRFGAPILLLAWLPVVGDPLCAVAGWLRLSFWQCALYIALGKFGRYLVLALAFKWTMATA